MTPIETPDSRRSEPLEPLIFDSDTENMLEEGGIACFDPSVLHSASQDDSSTFDNFYMRHATPGDSASTVSAKVEPTPSKHPAYAFNLQVQNSSPPSDTRSDSPEGSSHTSSSGSPPTDRHGPSEHSMMSFSHASTNFNDHFNTDDWNELGRDHSAPTEGVFDANMNMQDDFLDLEASNKVMDAAFDFESAASTPHSSKKDALRVPQFNGNPFGGDFTASPNAFKNSSNLRFKTPEQSAVMNAQQVQQPTPAPCDLRSPTSEMEETLGNIHMSGSSPIDPSFQSIDNTLDMAGPMRNSYLQQPTSSRTPTQASCLRSTGAAVNPRLIVHPTAQKSRVETQIPIRLTLAPLPAGAKKIRLPRHTVSKPKFFAKGDTNPSPEVLELHTNVVCTSAMQDPAKLEGALARARGEQAPSNSENLLSPESPLNGGDVRICSNCIKRERKRANRKKQRKPEEEELFQRDEERRIIVFNTTELREWSEPPRGATSEPLPANAMQVELPMRIACYCRHQSEKLGFQVIFTIKDYQGNLVAQTITHSIMITDDHKTHTSTSAQPIPSVLPDGFSLSGAGVFSVNSSQVDLSPNPFQSTQYRMSHSTSDLSNMQQPSVFPFLHNGTQMTRIPNGVAYPTPVSVPNTSSALTTGSMPTPSSSRTRQTSPVERPGPSLKRRKHSSTPRIPPELTMTRLDGSTRPTPSPAPASVPDTQPKQLTFSSLPDCGFAMPAAPSQAQVQPQASPVGPDVLYQSNESINQNLFSAPNSAHTSRPGSPSPVRAPEQCFPHVNPLVGNQMFDLTPPATLPRLPPAMIHKLVPGEGSTSGGNEVIILGSGFFPGMEVVFGETLATTTTFWGDKCLNCLTPPALHPGKVQVTFKHEHPVYGGVPPPPQTQLARQTNIFTYVDDRELQTYRLALTILGQKLGNPVDAYQTAQQIMGGDTTSLWNLQNGFSGGASNGGSGQQSRPDASYRTHGFRTNDLDIKMTQFLKFFDLDFNEDIRSRVQLAGFRDRDLLNERSVHGGQTLLHLASSLGLVRFANGLLVRGADPDAKDNNDNTPLHLAALGGYTNIINRLRLAGADIAAVNKGELVPADLASTLDAHQAVVIPRRKSRSRSVGSSRSRRNLSSTSLDKFWEPSTADSSPAGETSDSSDEVDSSASVSESSENSDSSARHVDGRASLLAWRDQLVAQINAFQQSVNRAFPNLTNPHPMPNLSDFSNNNMLQRMKALVPNGPPNIVRDGWDRLTGQISPHTTSPPTSPPPPAYEELYPDEKQQQEAFDVKQSSIIEAAMDAAADSHFEATGSVAPCCPHHTHLPLNTKPDKELLSMKLARAQRRGNARPRERRLKRIGSEFNMIVIWIPLFVVTMILMLRNFIPDAWEAVVKGYFAFRNHYRAISHVMEEVAAIA